MSYTEQYFTTDSHPNFLRNKVSVDNQFQYTLLQKEHIDKTVVLFTEAFCRSEPMTKYLEMDEEKYKIFARAVVEKAEIDQLSVVALDGKKVIACALVEDLADPGALPDFDPKFEYILALLEQLGKSFFPGKEFPKKHIAHLFITAVAADYRHYGLSTQINFQAMDLAAAKGFDFVYCEFTHHFNRRGVINHLVNRKKLIGAIPYNKFTFQGKKPFPDLYGGAYAYLWEIREGAKLTYKVNNINITEQL